MLFTGNLQNHRVSLYVWVSNQWTTRDVWVPHLMLSLCFLHLRTESVSYITLIGTPAQGNLHFTYGFQAYSAAYAHMWVSTLN